MRILIVHNEYGSSAPSGENEVVRAELTLLREHGHDVRLFSRKSDEIRGKGWRGAVQGALSTPWNPFEAHRIRKEVETFLPDVLHAHNTFPLISPSIFRAASKVPARVLTLHNYRLLCAAAIPSRKERPCTICIDGRTVLPGLWHACYRGSRLATAPLAAGIALHRTLGTWSRDIEAFIALSEFQRSLMVGGGLAADKVEIKPNFYPGRPTPLAWAERKPHCIYVGRLSAEKGVAKLIDAWNTWGIHAPDLHVVGDGPLRQDLERAALPGKVRFFGQLHSVEAQKMIAGARLLILPSECFEGFPMVLREAFAFGTPVAVSDLGPLPSLVNQGQCGLLLAPFDSKAFLKSLQEAWADPARLEAVGIAGHAEFISRYTAEANYSMLMSIYERARARK